MRRWLVGTAAAVILATASEAGAVMGAPQVPCAQAVPWPPDGWRSEAAQLVPRWKLARLA